MKIIILVAALLTIIPIRASATAITIQSATSVLDATVSRDAWLAADFASGSTPQMLEDFENASYGPFNQLNTGVGTFSIMPGGLPSRSIGTETNQFTVLNSTDSPFDGRFNTTPGGSKWLDSNDITELQLGSSLYAIYFFMTDVNDIDGKLTIQTGDGANSTAFAPQGANGDLYFVGITSSQPIGSIQWLNTSQDDGFGVDDFGTVQTASQVPEPGTSLVVGIGLIGLSLIRKRKKG